jgi:hypothetical protein
MHVKIAFASKTVHKSAAAFATLKMKNITARYKMLFEEEVDMIREDFSDLSLSRGQMTT